MGNILLLTHVKKDDTSGVWKKVLAQRAAFKRMGFSTDLVYESDNSLIIESNKGCVKYSLKHRYLFFYVLSIHLTNSYDFVYLRKPHGGLYPLFTSLVINKIKEINSSCVIFMEIPTYPYNKEQVGMKGIISDFSYRVSLFFYKKHLKEILYIGEGPDEIYGVTAKKINNGVDLENVICHSLEKKENNTFVFAGVANLMYWHGYDRLISSISNYEGMHEIVFYIVGESEPEYSRLKRLVSEKKLTEQVIFMGRLNNDEINSLLLQANVCVDALGRHRSGNNVNSSIKSKEYTAMGLPFIKSHIDDSFNENDFFVYQVAADDKDIEIDDIIKWYQYLPNDFPVLERQVAESRFSWEKIFLPIFNDSRESE